MKHLVGVESRGEEALVIHGNQQRGKSRVNFSNHFASIARGKDMSRRITKNCRIKIVRLQITGSNQIIRMRKILSRAIWIVDMWC